MQDFFTIFFLKFYQIVIFTISCASVLCQSLYIDRHDFLSAVIGCFSATAHSGGSIFSLFFNIYTF